MRQVGRIATVCVAATSLGLAGCASRNGAVSEAPECSVGEPAYIIGATLLGAIAGAMLAGKNNRGQGAVIGAAAGGAVGATASHFIKQRCQKIEEARKRLYGVNVAAKEIEVKSAGIDWRTPDQTASDKKIDEGIATIIHSKSMFEVGSSELSRSTENDMRTIASAYVGTNNKVLIVGHTDNSGNAEQNLVLSERRARAVADVFASAGIPRGNIYYKGAGETRPIGDNTTEEGRALNRRVEVVELQTESGVIAYEAKQDANINYMQRAAKSQTARTTVTVAPLPQPPAVADVKQAPSSQAQPQKSADEKIEYAVALKPGAGIDFGGQPVNGRGVAVASAVGERAKSGSTFSFISRAFAANEAAYTETSCLSDPNQKTGVMRSLATGEEVSRRTSAYMPGLYGTSWTQTINGHLTGLSGVKVLRDGARVDDPPQMIVFKDYKAGDQTPTIKTSATARGFEGESGILYRVFLTEDAWPVRCVDLVFDPNSPGKTKFGRLYYDKAGIVHVANFAPTIPSDK